MLSTKTIDRVHTMLRWGLYAVAFMPLIIFREFFSPFHFGKVIVFRSWVEILFILYVLLVMHDRRFLPRWSYIAWAVTAFVGAFGLTTLTSVNIYQSFMGGLERMGGWFTILHFLVLFIILISIFKEQEDWLQLLRFSVIVSLTSVFYGLLQRLNCTDLVAGGFKDDVCEQVFGGNEPEGRLRIFGTIGNAALFSGYVLVNIYFAILLWSKKAWENLSQKPLYVALAGAVGTTIIMAILQAVDSATYPLGEYHVLEYALLALVIVPFLIKKFEPWMYGVTVILSIYAIYATAVRGTWAGIIISLFVLAMLWIRSSGNKRIGYAIGAIFLVLMAFQLGVMLAKDTDFVSSRPTLNRLSDVSLESRTLQTRFWAWESGLKGWADSGKTMLVGWGPENFNAPFAKYFNPQIYQGTDAETVFDRAHNMFIETLATMGLIGFLSYVSIFVALFVTLRKMWKEDSGSLERKSIAVLIAGTIGYMIHNMFFFDTFANFLVFFMLLGFVHVSSIKDETTDNNEARPWGSSAARAGVLVVLSALTLWSIYATNIRPAQANSTLAQGLILLQQNGSKADVLERYEEALAYDTFSMYDYINGGTGDRYALFILNNIPELTADGADAEAALRRLIEQEEKLLERYHYENVPYIIISRAYSILGKQFDDPEANNKALEAALKAVDQSETFVRSYYEVAQTYLNVEDFAQAEVWFQQAVDLNDTVGLSHWYLGLSQLVQEKTDDGSFHARRAIELGHYPGMEDALRLAALFEGINDYEAAVVVYEKILDNDETNPQVYASLIGTYLSLNDTESAIDTAKNLIERFPELEVEARGYIRDNTGLEF